MGCGCSCVVAQGWSESGSNGSCLAGKRTWGGDTGISSTTIIKSKAELGRAVPYNVRSGPRWQFVRHFLCKVTTLVTW
jgi:hypothetical protein